MTQETPHVVSRKKLIEVALPLDAINKASAREKSIRHGHPSTLHLWWARRPLAAARAVIFAQMVDDPSANPDIFRGERAQERERKRLFGIIEELVKWENTTNKAVLERARKEIWQSWRRACADNAHHPRANEIFNRHVLPPFHDPFAGGGSLPLEAQRLGLEAHATDLNPVAVLINKAMIEIPPIFAGRPPVNRDSLREERLIDKVWLRSEGLAEDVSYYGRWMREEAEKRIGHFFPKVRVTSQMISDRPDLKPYAGRELTIIAWLWARTVKSPNPAFADVDVPLVSTFMLSKQAGKEAYIEPLFTERRFTFEVKVGKPSESANPGTKVGRASFVCLASGTPIPVDYIRHEGKSGRMGTCLMAMVAEGDRGRVYLSPTPEQRVRANQPGPKWSPSLEMPDSPRYIAPPLYGLTTFGDAFTDRQLVALTTLCDLAEEARVRIHSDAVTAGIPDDGVPLQQGGKGSTAYAQAVKVYLALAIDRLAMTGNSLVRWNAVGQKAQHAFGRQALPMVWDFAEPNPLADATGSISAAVFFSSDPIRYLPSSSIGVVSQSNATSQSHVAGAIISTDPPYYDNVGYADLSDFFYVWMRRTIPDLFPDAFATLSTPKAEELVATPYRHSNMSDAREFFLKGMSQAIQRLSSATNPSFPITIYYAFKQSEAKLRGIASSGWETFLDAVIRAGLSISGTWPVRTEMPTRQVAMNTNALASSIVLVCSPRAADAPIATRREFQDALRGAFPEGLANLQRSNIAPVDLAQASIGPGMAVFTRYSRVLNADGSEMSVREALEIISATRREILAEQEGDLDPDSRWAVTWFEQHGFRQGEFGVAEQLSKSENTSVDGLVGAGIIQSRRGRVRLLRATERDEDWDPASDSRLTVWEMTHHLICALESGGESAAARIARNLGNKAEAARDVAYHLFEISDRKKRTRDAFQYNSLVQSWPEIDRLSRQRPELSQIELPSQAENGR